MEVKGKMITSRIWKRYIGKNVKLIIMDTNFPKQRDGILIDIDNTHIFLQTKYKPEPIPYLRTSIKRVELQYE